MKLILAVALLALPVAAEEPLASAGEHTLTLKVQGSDRGIIVLVPKGFEPGKSVPLVVALHGAGGTGKSARGDLKLDSLADAKGFAVAYPDGAHRTWPNLNVGLGKHEDDELIGALIDRLVSDGVADPRRVFVTGMGTGAIFAHELAVVMSDRIAAIAPFGGTMLDAAAKRATPSRAVPVMYFHGTLDPCLSYDGQVMFKNPVDSLSAEEQVEWWAKHNGCKTSPSRKKLEDTVADGTTVEQWTYEGKAPVVFYRIEGGGHLWPAQKGRDSKTLGLRCHDLDANQVIWEFFAAHPMPEVK